MIIMGFFSVGLLALDFVGYFIRQWDFLIMAIAFPYAIYLSYWWYVLQIRIYVLKIVASFIRTLNNRVANSG